MGTIEMFVIAARDGSAAKEFYEKLFNWKIIDAGPLMQVRNAGINGHILKWPHQNHPTHVSFYVKVDNIGESLAKVEASGGKVILPEMKVPTGGSIAQFVDPDGNILGVYNGPKHQSISECSNQITYFEIAVREGQRSKIFFENVFNWNISDDGPVMSVRGEDSGIDGHLFNWTSEEHTYITLYVNVEHIGAYLEKVTSLGGKVIYPETPIPSGGSFAQFTDLDGNVIGIYSGR